MGTFYEGQALSEGRGYSMVQFAQSIHAIQGPGQIRVILSATLFPRSGNLVICTDSELIFLLLGGMFARRQAIPFEKIEALELNGRSIFVSFRAPEDPKPSEEGEEAAPPPEPREVLKSEDIKVACSMSDTLQLYEHLQRRWRASGAKAALDQNDN